MPIRNPRRSPYGDGAPDRHRNQRTQQKKQRRVPTGKDRRVLAERTIPRRSSRLSYSAAQSGPRRANARRSMLAAAATTTHWQGNSAVTVLTEYDAQKQRQRYTSTGIFECVSTLTVSLPRTTAETPRRPCDAITIKSHFLASVASIIA